MTKKHILIVAEKGWITNKLGNYLEKAGYLVSILERGEQVTAFIRQDPPNLIIMDIILQDTTALEVYLKIRRFSNIPVLMFTGETERINRLIIFELGSGEYIFKPFTPKEIVARVKLVLSRTYFCSSEKKPAKGILELNEDTRQVFINDHDLKLTSREFDLLRVMLAEPNQIFTREQLMIRLHPYDFTNDPGNERIIDSHIKNLRKKIAAILPNKVVVSSVYGIGYKLAPMILRSQRRIKVNKKKS